MSDDETDAAPAGRVQVTIFNQSYNLRSQSDGEHVRRIAQLVDERMRQVSTQMTTHEVGKIAVLAALNLADELQRTRDYYEREVRPLLERAAREAEEARARETQAAERNTAEREAAGTPDAAQEATGQPLAAESGTTGRDAAERATSQTAEPPPPAGSPRREPESWFEAIFDAPAPARERGERLSSQIAAKLQSLRQQSAPESLTIEAETAEADES